MSKSLEASSSPGDHIRCVAATNLAGNNLSGGLQNNKSSKNIKSNKNNKKVIKIIKRSLELSFPC